MLYRNDILSMLAAYKKRFTDKYGIEEEAISA